jgi:hypothetical protein
MAVGAKIAGKLGNFIKKDIIVDDKAGKAWHNGFTGKKMSNHWSLYTAGIAVGAAAYGVNEWKRAAELPKLKKGAQFDVGYIGRPDVMEADGVGSAPAPRNLNATGDIVFGLHNGRRG